MPRQTFATREFFVDCIENATRQNVLNLPLFFTRLTLSEDDQKCHAMRFQYFESLAPQVMDVSISILPLNDACTKITVHAAYASGCVFTKDPFITAALKNIEQAIHLSLTGCATEFEPLQPKQKFRLHLRKLKGNAWLERKPAFLDPVA